MADAIKSRTLAQNDSGWRAGGEGGLFLFFIFLIRYEPKLRFQSELQGAVDLWHEPELKNKAMGRDGGFQAWNLFNSELQGAGDG